MSDQDLWCSVHIYYHGDLDVLLAGCVEPLSRALRTGGLASRLFYLRYWRGGPHIRLRFRAAHAGAREAGLNAVCAGVNEYLGLHPSTTTLDHESYVHIEQNFSVLENEPYGSGELQPNNSCRTERYEPELTKYGGARGVAIAEEAFDASTSIALPLLKQFSASAEKKLGRAFVMLLAGVRGFGLPVEEASGFLAWYSQAWARYVPEPATQVWESRLLDNRDRLDRSARRILKGEATSDSAVGRWHEAMRRTAGALCGEGDSIIEAVGVNLPASRKRWFLLMNYLHTHNNRLGVMPSEEAYVSFLAYRIVEQIVGGAAD